MQTTLVLSLLFAGCLVDSATLFSTAPVKALDDVAQALSKVTALPHLSSSQQKSAKSVVDFVLHAVHDIENSKNMTKETKAKKVKEAITRLQGLEKTWEAAANNMTASERKIGELQAKIAEKRHELAKEEGKLKLAKLKKELMEKKLLLRKLVSQQASGSQEEKTDVKLKDAEVKQINKVATAVAKGNSSKAAKLAPVMQMLHIHEHELEESIKKIDEAEKKSDAEFAKLTASAANATNDAGVAKAQRMLKTVKKQNQRKLEKAKASKKAELADVMGAIKSLEAGDVKGIEKVIMKMTSQMEALTSHSSTSGSFIY